MSRALILGLVGLGAVALMLAGSGRSGGFDVRTHTTAPDQHLESPDPLPNPAMYRFQVTSQAELLVQITKIADCTNAGIKTAGWKLERKNVSSARGLVPEGTALAKSIWLKKNTRLSVEIFIMNSAEEAAETLIAGRKFKSRGGIDRLNGIGDHAVVYTDWIGPPGVPSNTSVTIYFTKGRIITQVGMINQSRKQKVNIREARKVAVLIDALLK